MRHDITKAVFWSSATETRLDDDRGDEGLSLDSGRVIEAGVSPMIGSFEYSGLSEDGELGPGVRLIGASVIGAFEGAPGSLVTTKSISLSK
jgi:hypothetical protein